MAEERERMIQGFMKDFGMTRAAAEQAVAIELGESSGDLVAVEDEDADGAERTGQKQ